jgi:hypothetical protein
MTNLPQTGQALRELRADASKGFGMHYGDEHAVGTAGFVVGEVPFDPSRHLASDIDPMSMGEWTMGMPQVTQVMPYRPINMNIVLHRDPTEQNLPHYLQPIRAHKNELARGLQTAIDESKQRTDKANTYLVGDTTDAFELGFDVHPVRGTESPEKAAEAIAGLCLNGLTIVISDFNNLPLKRGNKTNFARTIGVKANHGLELKIPANVGRLSVGGLHEVDTNKPKKLAEANTRLAAHHAGVCRNLGGLGIAVAQVAYDNQQNAGFNAREADRQIATAVRIAGRR